MSQYPYENLTDTEFESLIIRICKELLGIGCKTFSVGKDGAKDSWFDGKAERFPSTTGSWEGKFIIQAKHTTILNASCSDNDFFFNKKSILNLEIQRLQEIQKTVAFDNYILFTNRKLTGGKISLIETIKAALKLENVDIIGREQIDSYLNDYPHIANKFGLHRFASPLRFYEKDLRDVIIAFSNDSVNISEEASNYITSFIAIDKEYKNEINNLSEEYFDFIKNNSLQYFKQIDDYLKDPKNTQYRRMYEQTISDLKAKIILERDRFTDFQFLIEHLVEFLVQNNHEELVKLRDKVRVFIHFMYFNCDIGKVR